MKKKLGPALSIAAGLTASGPVFLAHRFVHEERIVDECLSDRHRSFDYSAMTYYLHANHVYVPYRVRHPHDGFFFPLGTPASFAASFFVERRAKNA